MLTKIGAEIADIEARKAYLKDNCDDVENVNYMKHFTPEIMAERKHELSEKAIEINDISEERAEAMAQFKNRLKPLLEDKSKILRDLKNKGEFVTEPCYKFVHAESRMVGFYNAEGDLVNSRPAFAKELQGSLFEVIRNTGTNN